MGRPAQTSILVLSLRRRQANHVESPLRNLFEGGVHQVLRANVLHAHDQLSLLLLLLLSLIQLSGPVAAILSGALPVDWDQFGVGVAFLIGGEVVRRPIFCLLRVLYLRRAVGLSDAEITDIVGTR